ncbi:glycosyltransferase family A protein [Geitlerinema sp. PCC 9228]|uniref:glycosyltransferase family A protein n=1 Tax=Geitlerinema sp. PCC 9228 TaxID=111611 RepID=UPI0008F9BF85|nr:glycosyltransferase family A protein [Geitlerinema sp. PCC 9228]
MNLPSFSLIIESENLTSCDPQEIQNMLDSLLNQTVSITTATEVIIGNNGLIPEKILASIKTLIPNLQCIDLERETTYYQAKNLLAEKATGEIVVFCDSDCVYNRQWLETILHTFANHPDIEIVRGETVIDVKGIYSLAIAVNYILHRSQSDRTLVKSNLYYFNNVAFKRNFLLQNPLPDQLKLFRGICSVHARFITANGHEIWLNKMARACHLPPQNITYYFFRFLIMGHDNYWLDRYLSIPQEQNKNNLESCPKTTEQVVYSVTQTNQTPAYQKKPIWQRIKHKYSYFLKQINIYKKEYQLPVIQIIVALPIVIFSQFLVNLGRSITQFNALFTKEPHWLYRLSSLLD